MPHRIRNPKAPATDAQRELVRTLSIGEGTDRHEARTIPPKAASKARRVVGQRSCSKGRADEVIQGLLSYPVVTIEPPKATLRKTRKAKATEQTAMLYRIEVLKARGWTERTIVEAASPDKALTGYGIRGRKIREGVRIADSGKRFRALNTGIVA